MKMSSTTKTRSVRFADTAQLYIVGRHEDYKNKINSVARHDLWYTKSDYYSMRRAIEQDVLQVRAQALVGAPFNYAGDDEASAFESSVCCVGIEHLLTPAFILETAACRARCILAVLIAQAQAGLDVSELDIALASLTQTRSAQLRARKRGMLLQDSI
ncbi:hypothetical protein QTG54_015227 [Skeletonema marinoi]|uniref:Uncharacterized protein n=1 Tax=Skeletonema marinoi TaxID=267567 RepID=A0AAD8XUR7_9STRA|nr:hypothetical protein QTG54_015227 [Skeletonema marinoi]